ncbi:MAG: hypothetical protein ACSHYB_06870 [Roseibacillus sp.]
MMSIALSQDKSDDLLLVSVGESSNRYSEVALHLQGLFAGTPGMSEVQIDIHEDSNIESLADGYYDKNPEDIALRAKAAEGYGNVILIPTIHTTPTGTIEYSEFGGGPANVYDDAPLDNEYFAPEVFYEGCTQLSKIILSGGSKPMVFLPLNSDENLSDYGPVMYRVANGVGMELVPGAYAVDAATSPTQAEQHYLYACTLFSHLTGLNATTSSYSPSGISSEDATTFANTAETAVTLNRTTSHYSTSYENDGAVVYRSLDVTSAPFNNTVRYMYKGSSTQDWTSDALDKIIGSNPPTTVASRKLGTRNGVYSPGVRYWHPDDIADQGFKFALEPNQAALMYVSGSWAGAGAQETIDMTQANMIPFAFDWIKSFAISPAVSGTASTVDALDYHSCVELYFNYAERGWKLIPLTIGMGRINEAVPNFVASDDALHSSDPLVYMNAYMMLSSALGTQFPLPATIDPADIHRGSYTTEQIHEACLIGHELIKELAHLSETGDFVPDTDLEILTDELPEVPLDVPFTHQLSASGGDSHYTWALAAETSLPLGLTLSNTGLISGTVTGGYGTSGVAFQIADGTGAFRKVGLKLATPFPARGITSNVNIFAAADTNYGTDTVATMYSAMQTAPDGLATFRIAINIDPMAGTSITSQAQGLWGINSGEGPSGWWTTFDGSLSQSVDSISNIHITDFNANGGNLTLSDFTDLSFTSITVRNGANTADRVKVVAEGLANNPNGLRMASDPATIDLLTVAGTRPISSFTIANGNIGNSKDRWNIESIAVEFTVQSTTVEDYASWVASYGLAGNDALLDADTDDDNYDNLIEYALGMNPTQADASSKETYFTEEDNGAVSFVYEYERRTDYFERGLSYTLIETQDLITSATGAPTQVTVGDPIDGFETVTTHYLIGDPIKFIQLEVTLTSQ